MKSKDIDGDYADSMNDRRNLSKNALVVSNLSKSFKLPTEKANGLKQTFINFCKGVKGYKEFRVLNNINFEVKQGDFFGVVGRNGSGKSTLLKIISQIYTPDKGDIEVNGKLVPFIELGVGFNPELTGRENVYMNGALLGFSNSEVDDIYDEIVEFSELQDFMEQKLKNYSSGMQVRLAFSIAIKAEAEILVLDEVLAVGDEAFQRKCNEYFAKLKKNRKTVILVTHDMAAVQNYCNRAMLINDGGLVLSGTPMDVARAYHKLNFPDNSELEQNDGNTHKFNKALLNVKFKKTDLDLAFNVQITAKQSINDAVITFVIQKSSGEFIYRWTSDEKIKEVINFKKNTTKTLNVKVENTFADADYTVQVGLKDRDRTEEYAIFDDAVKFSIINKGSYPGDIYWKLREEVKLKDIK